MVDRAPSSLLLEPGAPMWAQRLALRLDRAFVGLFPSAPVRLWSVLFADLPSPADWTGCLVWVPDKGKVAVSNGAAWVVVDGGVL